MPDIIKPATMILTLQALQYMGRRQLSIGMVACFRFGAAHVDSLLTEAASHAAWSRLTGLLTPIDGGAPANARSLVVHDGYRHRPAASGDDADRPSFFGMETLRLESRIEGRTSLSVALPRLRAQCTVEWSGARGEQVRKLDPQIESVRLSPRLGCGWIVYRATTPVPSACAEDIASISANWRPIDRPTVHPDHGMTLYADRHAAEQQRYAAARESLSRHGLADPTCVR